MATQKTTQTVESKITTQLDRSTKSLTSALSNIQSVVDVASDAAKTLTEITEQVQEKSAQLSNLSLEYDNQVRLHEAELKIKVAEGKKDVLASLMSEFGLATISVKDLTQLQNDLTHANREINNEISNAVEITKTSLEKEYSVNIASLQSKFDVEKANLEAELKSAKRENDFLSTQIESKDHALAAEREARVEIEKSRSLQLQNQSRQTQ